jgi:hypothetical protein
VISASNPGPRAGVSGHTNPFLDDVAIHQLTALTGTSELTSLYSLIAFNLISATLSVGASGVASSDGTVDVDAALIEIAEIRAVPVVDRSAVNGNRDSRISVICLE